MLEKLPTAIGRRLRRVRPGVDHVLSARQGIASAPATIHLTSPAFADGQPIPSIYTADGLRTSPPLLWTGVPDGARSLALIVEDADSPTPSPLVHAIAADLPPVLDDLEEGALLARADDVIGPTLGRNSYFQPGWMPPDPPPGHGEHRYVFQIFALDYEPKLGSFLGRHALVSAIAGHVVARGQLVGTYRRS